MESNFFSQKNIGGLSDLLLKEELKIANGKVIAAYGIPRRSRMDLLMPAERAICDAMAEVEKSGADVLLTDAIRLLQEARDKVADYVDAQICKANA